MVVADLISFCLPALIFVSCASTKESSAEVSALDRCKKIAVEKYGRDLEYAFNDSKTHILCKKESKPTTQNPQHRVEFFVYDTTRNKLLFEDSLPDGKVSWINDHQLQITIIPGIVRGDESNPVPPGYIYDVINLTKLPNKRPENQDRSK